MKSLLHAKASPEALEFLYFWIFGLWLFILVSDPLPDLACMPKEVFNPTGFLLRGSPEQLQNIILTRSFLEVFRWTMITTATPGRMATVIKLATLSRLRNKLSN